MKAETDVSANESPKWSWRSRRRIVELYSASVERLLLRKKGAFINWSKKYIWKINSGSDVLHIQCEDCCQHNPINTGKTHSRLHKKVLGVQYGMYIVQQRHILNIYIPISWVFFPELISSEVLKQTPTTRSSKFIIFFFLVGHLSAESRNLLLRQFY